MNIRNLVPKHCVGTGITGFFSSWGSFGHVDGTGHNAPITEESQAGYCTRCDDFSARCSLREMENGVLLRQDTFIAHESLVLNGYTSRFLLENGDYEVYTQFSTWQTESLGGWQNLITGIEVSNFGIRTTDGAAPMMAVRNKGNGKILVLHLLPNAQWKIKIAKVPLTGKNIGVIIDAGINDKRLHLQVHAGETVEMPHIFLYEAKSKLDLDAWKLHDVYNQLYPRKMLPVLYNTWLLNFGTLDVKHIQTQADTAAELGVEMFLIDAGWFGNGGDWSSEIGNWVENQQNGFGGKLNEVGNYVRKKGMKFGLWLEPERALTATDAYKAHPDYYKLSADGNAFLDFANTEARAYITSITLGLIEKYKLDFMKFDFNASLAYDESGNGFYRYLQGAKQFVNDIRQKHPNIYITNCASGGTRMDLYQNTIFDSVWSSDNQSPIAGFRIYKDTALRMPPCHIEKWDVRRFVYGLPLYGRTELTSLPLSCNNATWSSVVNVTSAYTHSFLTGAPIGFSTDIAIYPEEEKQALKQHIAKFKEDRAFYIKANLRILYDTTNISAIQYSDAEFNRIIIQVFTNIVNQSSITIYPVLDENSVYFYGNSELKGSDIACRGLCIDIADIDCCTIDLKKGVYHENNPNCL